MASYPCMVCGGTLVETSSVPPLSYEHSGEGDPPDHIAIPDDTPRPDRCDFCDTPDDASWVLPVRPFEFDGIQKADVSIEGWQACNRCALKIAQGGWDELCYTVAVEAADPHEPDSVAIVQGGLMRLWRLVAANSVGEPVRRR